MMTRLSSERYLAMMCTSRDCASAKPHDVHHLGGGKSIMLIIFPRHGTTVYIRGCHVVDPLWSGSPRPGMNGRATPPNGGVPGWLLLGGRHPGASPHCVTVSRYRRFLEYERLRAGSRQASIRCRAAHSWRASFSQALAAPRLLPAESGMYPLPASQRPWSTPPCP